MSRKDPIASEIESFDEEDLPELGPEWDAVAAGGPVPEPVLGDALAAAARDALAPLDEAFHGQVAHFAGLHYRKKEAPARSRRAFWLAIPALLAASALVALRPGSAVPLPPYQAEWRVTGMDVRGEAANAVAVGCDARDAAPRFADGGAFEVSFAPATTATGVRATVTVDGAPLPATVHEAGVVVVRGTVGEPPLALAAGWHCLVAEIGPQRIELGFWIAP